MTLLSKSLGNKGEELACTYLQTLGYTVLERNKRIGRGEVDIICLRDETLIFVEVKSGHASPHFRPEQHFTHRKAKQLRNLASLYLGRRTLSQYQARIDLITVIFESRKNAHQLEHFENVA